MRCVKLEFDKCVTSKPPLSTGSRQSRGSSSMRDDPRDAKSSDHERSILNQQNENVSVAYDATLSD